MVKMRWCAWLFVAVLFLAVSPTFASAGDGGVSLAQKAKAKDTEPGEPAEQPDGQMNFPEVDIGPGAAPVIKKAPGGGDRVVAPATVAPVPAGGDYKLKYFSAALKVDCLVPPRDVTTTIAITVELRYLLPFHENRLSLGVEAGWYALQGSGKGSDAELGGYAYSYYINNIPIFIGPAYELPIPGLDRTPFDLFISGGFAMVISQSHGIAFGSRSQSDAVALGYYAGAGAEFDIWIGRILAEVRYTSAWTDYGLPQKGSGNGDLGGVNIYAGYRFVL